MRMRSYRIRGRRARRAARPIMDSSPGASRLPENGSTLVDLPPPIALLRFGSRLRVSIGGRGPGERSRTGVPGEAASISQPVLRALGMMGRSVTTVRIERLN